MYQSYLDIWKEHQREQIEGYVYNFIDQFIERHTGKLLPPDYHLTGASQVLDIACGYGEWVCSMARVYPDSTVTGCDKNAKYITYARERAGLAGLTNAHFAVGNMYTLPQPEATYDLVHARLLSPAVIPGTWYYLLKELWRHCKCGGQLVWTETRMPATDQSASARWCHLFGQALGISSGTGDVIAHMPTMLKDVGFENIQPSTTTIHLQHGTPAYNMLVSTLWRTSPLLQTFFVQSGVASANHFIHITDEMLVELVNHSFTCNWSLHTVIARRPNT
jgi:ubiquinone/menaquinone biosynthesis C-methylase UbiE